MNAIIAAFAISLVSFVGVLSIPFANSKKFVPLLVALAAGSMLGDVFLHLLPNIIEDENTKFNSTSLIWVIVGIIIFYLLETVLHWHHHHDIDDTSKPHHISSMILISDSLHNFFDGVGIAVAFAINPTVGIATTIAFMIHELPQEFGDYAIFISSGWSKKKALLVNFLSGLSAVVGAIVGTYAIGIWNNIAVPITLLTAGSLIYIALADLIPESNKNNLHHHKSFRFLVFLCFIIGIAIMYSLTFVESVLGVG
jgi:zinc and cadmium transporter